MEKIIISVSGISVEAELNNSITAKKLLSDLPIESTVNLWGDEIYFNIPTTNELESDARSNVEVGELGYWPVGPAFCIFFGPTPVSMNGKPRAYSPVNIIGKIVGETSQLKNVASGSKITVTKK